MTKAQVAQFGKVQICMRSEAQEKAAHAALLDVAWSVSPRVEDTAADTVVLDLEGLTGLFGTDENIARELARRVAAIGLAARVAVAANIEVAIHAARGFPGITLIPAGEERQRLGALPVGVLTTEVETLGILERWGVETLQALAALPVLQLSERLGQEGVRLSELARGVRQRSLVLAQASSSFTEELELDDAVEELEPLSFLLGRLLDQLCARLEARALAVRAAHVAGRFANETGSEAVRKSADAAGADAQCEDAVEAAAAATARGSSGGADPENLHDGGCGCAASGAERIVCALRAGSGEVGSNDCAAGKVGGAREFGLRGIGG